MSQNPETQRSDRKPSKTGTGKGSNQAELSKEQLDGVAGGVNTSEITISKQTDKPSPSL